MVNSINTNISAYYAQSNISVSSQNISSAVARLSSGNRIVRASDDVAALSIGTSLRTQVSTLKIAKQNISSGSSLLQVADGALAQAIEILQRQKSIATQAGSGSLTSTERGFLNQEFQALTKELDRLASSTNFNGVSLLSGALSQAARVESATTQSGTAAARLTLNSNMSNNETVIINGITFTAKTSPSTATGSKEFQIGLDAAGTVANLATRLNALASVYDTSNFPTTIGQGVYSASGNTLVVTARSGGSLGSNFTLNVAGGTGTVGAQTSVDGAFGGTKVNMFNSGFASASASLTATGGSFNQGGTSVISARILGTGVSTNQTLYTVQSGDSLTGIVNGINASSATTGIKARLSYDSSTPTVPYNIELYYGDSGRGLSMDVTNYSTNTGTTQALNGLTLINTGSATTDGTITSATTNASGGFMYSQYIDLLASTTASGVPIAIADTQTNVLAATPGSSTTTVFQDLATIRATIGGVSHDLLTLGDHTGTGANTLEEIVAGINANSNTTGFFASVVGSASNYNIRVYYGDSTQPVTLSVVPDQSTSTALSSVVQVNASTISSINISPVNTLANAAASQLSITNVQATANDNPAGFQTITFTMASTASLAAGDYITVAGLTNDSGLNGTFAIQSVASGTTITVRVANGTVNSGSALASAASTGATTNNLSRLDVGVTSGGSTVRVVATSHGLRAGDYFQLTGVGSAIGGIAAADLTQTYQVASVIDANRFTFTAVDATTGAVKNATSTAGSGATASGTAVQASQFITTSGSRTVIVQSRSHGFATGDTATIAGLTSALNGIPITDINKAHTVTRIDNDHFSILVDTAASTTAGNGLYGLGGAAGTIGTVSVDRKSTSGADNTQTTIYALGGGNDSGLGQGSVSVTGTVGTNSVLTGLSQNKARVIVAFPTINPEDLLSSSQFNTDGSRSITVGGQRFNFTTTAGTAKAANEITIGSTLQETLDNVVATVNAYARNSATGDTAFQLNQIEITREGNNLVFTGKGISNVTALDGSAAGAIAVTGFTNGTTVSNNGNLTNSSRASSSTFGVDVTGVSNAGFNGKISGFTVTASATANVANVSVKIGDYTYTASNITTNPTAADQTVRFYSDTLANGTNGGYFDLQLAKGNGQTVAANSQVDANGFAARFNAAFDGLTFRQERVMSSYDANRLGVPSSLIGSKVTAQLPSFDANKLTSISVTAPTTTADAKISITIDGVEYVSASGIGSQLGAYQTFRFTSTENVNNYIDFTMGDRALDLSTAAAAKVAEDGLAKAFGVDVNGGALSFQVGAAASDTLSVSISSTKTDSLFDGETLDVTTQANAVAAAAKVSAALVTVTSIRADLGALQSRFNYAAANIESSIQNQDAARGEQLDTDIASESTMFATAQVKMQAGISVLAQANQQLQSLLKLIG